MYSTNLIDHLLTKYVKTPTVTSVVVCCLIRLRTNLLILSLKVKVLLYKIESWGYTQFLLLMVSSKKYLPCQI